MNKLKGLIYKTQNYTDHAKLLFCFTNKGKVTVLAHGALKLNSENRILSQYLTEIEFEYSKFKTFLLLRKGKILNDFKEIKSSYLLTKDASLMLELINKVDIDEIYYNKIYELLIDALNSPNVELSSLSFSLKLAFYLGYGMDLKGNGNEIIGFNLINGTVVYKGEDIKLDLNYDETFALLKLTYSDYDINDPIIINNKKAIKDFIYKYYIDKIDLELKVLL